MKKSNLLLHNKYYLALALFWTLSSFLMKGLGQVPLGGWDFSTVNVPAGSQNFGPSPLAATTTSVYATIGGLTRGSGLDVSVLAAAQAWGGNGWKNNGNENSAINTNSYITFTVQANAGYVISLTSLNPLIYRRSATGPVLGSVQYSLDGITFIDIVALSYSVANTATSIGPINLSGVAALQNLYSNTTVTFRIVNWNANSNSGTWYLADLGNTTVSDFVINGITTTAPSNYYRSIASGNWNNAAIWQSAPTASGPWLSATAPPTSASLGDEIQSGDTVTMNSSQVINGYLKLSSGILDINGNILTVNGTTSGIGALKGSITSSLVVGGTANALLFTSGGTANYVKDLTVTSTGMVTLANELNITGGVSFGTVNVLGSSNLFSKGFLIFKSDAFGTAQLVSGTISDTVTVERYITPKRAYRLLTFPGKSQQTLFSALQEGTSSTILTCPPQNIGVPGFGTNLTYRYSDIANGYDLGPQNQLVPSIRGWINNAFFDPPTTTGTLINASDGFFIFVRGDKQICMVYGVAAGSNGTVLRVRTILPSGTVTKTPAASAANQYILVGNPYMSSVDLTGVLARSTGIDKTKFWLWDPSIATTGGYVSFSNGTSSPVTANYPTSASTLIMQSGQSFFLQTTTANPSVVFMESDKTASESSVFSRVIQPELQVALLSDTASLLDGVAVQFTTDSLKKSARKLSWTADQLSLKKDSLFSIESRILPSEQKDTVFLELAKMSKKNYILQVSPNALMRSGMDIRLRDRMLNTDTSFTKDSVLRYVFTAHADTTDKNRFAIIYSKKVVAVTDTHVPLITKELSVAPNPVHDQLTIKGPPIHKIVTITDMYNRVVFEQTIVSNKINCSFLKSGVYSLRVGEETVRFIKL